LVLYNPEYKSGGVQKLSGAVFCTRPTAEKQTVLHQINGELVLHKEKDVLSETAFLSAKIFPIIPSQSAILQKWPVPQKIWTGLFWAAKPFRISIMTKRFCLNCLINSKHKNHVV